MIDIVLVTSSPAAVRTALINRGVCISDGAGGIVGAKAGFEFTANTVPNPIVTTLAVGTPGQGGYVPPVMDSRKVYLIRLSAAEDTDDDDGINPQVNDRFARSKLVQWVIANSVAETITGADGKTYRTRRVTGNNVWFVIPADASAFGAWQ